MKKLSKYWNDAVWSKVIAAGILFILGQIGVFIWGKVNNINFLDTYKSIISFLKSDCSIPCWIVILILLTLSVLFWKVFKRKKNNKIVPSEKYQEKESEEKKNVTKEANETLENPKPIVINEAPTVFFHQRFCDAFPGFDRGYQWFTKKSDIHTRLKILLKQPTRFDKSAGHGTTVDPIWWFRGTSALPISDFKVLSRNKILLNFEELIIEKLAAYRGRSYYQDFVYLQCKADKPTGLYNFDRKYILERLNEEIDYEYTEEYGLYKNRKISRQEYDDGSAIIKGKPQPIEDAELRIRFLTDYNIIISSKFSPYNCNEFNRDSGSYFGRLLNNEIEFDEFVEWLKTFPKNRSDY